MSVSEAPSQEGAQAGFGAQPHDLGLRPILCLDARGDLVSLLGNGPYTAHDGFLWWLRGDTAWTY